MILLYRPRLEALPIFRLRHDRLVLLMATTILFTKFVSTTASGPRRHRRPPRGLSIEKGRGRRRRGRAVVLPRAQRGLQKEARLDSILLVFHSQKFLKKFFFQPPEGVRTAAPKKRD